MTQKRFTDNGIEDIENQSFTDNLTGKTYWIDHGLDEIIDLLNVLTDDENEKLKKENLNLSEELDYYKAKCASLETGLFQADKENKQLKMGVDSLKLLVQNWEALDDEKDEQLDKQNQALKKLRNENEQLYELIDFANILISFNNFESCQKEWEKRLKELKE